MLNYFHDTNHIRYELVASHEGKPYNWLFLPGGPGGDSSYLHTLVDNLELPGNVWLIDLPGNGSNTESVPADYSYDSWFEIFIPMIQKFENPILVGHSFGGMFPLFFPDLEKHLKGMIFLNSSPSLWKEEAVSYAEQYNLPSIDKEMQNFIQCPNDATFKIALDACMPYYFPATTLDKARPIMSSFPFRFQPAVWWQHKVLELDFSNIWVPQNIPALIVTGTYDCICPYYLFQKDERFKRSNIDLINVDNGGHLPWFENLEMVKNAFEHFCQRL
ncbi:MAG TPA: alpha/beta hydrolase [Rhabdochlamydiaceae bacterium]|nr:alpha/beta hydrolase [Rhabdochlamydiaceae bacterium]